MTSRDRPVLGTSLRDGERGGFDPPHEHRNVVRPLEEQKLGISVQQRAWAKAYRHGDFYICLKIAAGREREEYHLVLGVIPPINVQTPAALADANDARHNRGLSGHTGHSKCDLMLRTARYSAECFECVISTGVPIPSRVWLAEPEDWEQLLRDSLAVGSPPAGKTVFKVIGTFSEREVALPVALTADNLCRREDRLIERAPETFDCIRNDAPRRKGKRFRDADFDLILSGLRIELGDFDACFVFDEKVFSEGLQILCLCRAPRGLKFSAFERIF